MRSVDVLAKATLLIEREGVREAHIDVWRRNEVQQAQTELA